MTRTHSGPFVLLVDDSDDDAYFFSRALKSSGFAGEWRHLADGAAAVAFFARLEADPAVPRPDLVFLDLKMPQLSGFEVLSWIRDHPFVPPLDIAVLSGSEDAADVTRATALGATGYYVKPILVQQLKTRLATWEEKTAQAGGVLRARAVLGPDGLI